MEVTPFWVVVFAVPAGLAALALAATVLGRGTPAGQAGRRALAIVLLLFGAAVTWWNVMWGFSPLTLEGAWLWPLAIVPLVGGVLLLRRVRPTPGEWA